MKKSLQGLKNPYGDGCSSGKIVEKVKSIQIEEFLIKKKFYEIPS
jgi:UDP-N-acetylglucosamine 2-epimerase